MTPHAQVRVVTSGHPQCEGGARALTSTPFHAVLTNGTILPSRASRDLQLPYSCIDKTVTNQTGHMVNIVSWQDWLYFRIISI